MWVFHINRFSLSHLSMYMQHIQLALFLWRTLTKILCLLHNILCENSCVCFNQFWAIITHYLFKYFLFLGLSILSFWNSQFSSVQVLSHSVMSDSLPPHGLQHARPSCPSPTPAAYSNSRSLCWWCHPTISSCVISFSRFQSFPASGSFPMSQFFASGGHSIGVSASLSVLSMNI